MIDIREILWWLSVVMFFTAVGTMTNCGQVYVLEKRIKEIETKHGSH